MQKQIQVVQKSGCGGAVYCLGLFGAAFYYLQHATSISDGLMGILKAILWPGFFVYKAIELMQF